MSMINSLKMAMGITKAPAKTVAKEVSKVASKPAAKVEAKAADAMEAQGRAMVKMENPKSLRATSGAGGNGGAGGGDEWFDDAPAQEWGSIW